MTDPPAADRPAAAEHGGAGEHRGAGHRGIAASLNGLAQLLTDSEPLEGVLQRIAAYAQQAVPGAEGAGLVLLDSRGSATVVGSTEFVREVDALQGELDEGPCVNAVREQRAVLSGSLGGEPRWPRFGPRAGRLGIHSGLAVPLLIPGELLGAMTLYARGKHAFSAESIACAERYSVPAAVSINNARVLEQTRQFADQLTNALNSRSQIDQAIGILMSRTGATSEEAMERLRSYSRAEQTKVSAVAARIVDDAVRRARSRRQS